MATYLILNVVFMATVLLALKAKPLQPYRAFIATLIVLVALTAIFDNLIVGLSIVDYNPGKILGLKIGYAPIEDFMYTILAVVMIPVIWQKLRAKDAK